MLKDKMKINYYHISNDTTEDLLNSSKKNYYKYITPSNSLKIHKHYFIAYDIENESSTGLFKVAFFSGQYKTANGQVKEIKEYCPNYKSFIDFFAKMKDYTFDYITYNLSYDGPLSLEVVDTSQTLSAGSRLIKLGLKKEYGEHEIWDIQNNSGIEYKLEDWIKILKMKEKYGIYKASLTNDYERVSNDAIATDILTRFIVNFFEKQGVTMRYTIGSNAIAIFRQRFLKYPLMRYYKTIYEYHNDYLNNITLYGKKLMSISDNLKVEEYSSTDMLERAAYLGGRNEIFKRGFLEVASKDFNSMYLGCLDMEYPNPESAVYLDKLHMDKLSKGWEWYYRNRLCILDCLIEVDDNQIIAPIPFKNVPDEEDIIYATGTHRGIYTSVELLNAEKYGLKILEVYSMIYYKSTEKYFKPFMDFVWNNRVKYKSKCANMCLDCLGDKHCEKFIDNPQQNKPMDIMNKKIGNSLIGKFGQKNPYINYCGREIDMPDDLRDIIFSSGINFDTKTYDDELWIIYTSKEFSDARYGFVCWATFCTAYARVKLLNEAKQIEKFVIYMDTDSIKFIPDKSIEFYMTDSKLLGHMSLEYVKDCNNVEVGEYFYGCKNYGAKCKGTPNRQLKESVYYPKSKTNPDLCGRLIVNSKDIFLRGIIIKNDAESGYMKIQFEKPFKMRSALRQGKKMSSWEKIVKTVLCQDKKRNWNGNKFYNQGVISKPKHIEYKLY